MLRLHLHNLCAQHAACLQQVIQVLSYATHARRAAAETETAAVIPEQWRDGFVHTAPVPADAPASTTAFSWAKKQVPDIPLSLLGKFFKLRQVRVVQDGQVKRVSRTRDMVPGDILLLPKDLPAAGSASNSSSSSNKRATKAAAPAQLAAFQAHTDGPLLQQQQPQQQQQRRYQEVDLLDLQQQQEEETLELNTHWLQQQLITTADLPDHPQQQQQLWQQSALQQQQPSDQQQQHHQQQQHEFTVKQIRKWMLASSQDIAVIYKPPGVSFQRLTLQSGHSQGSKTVTRKLSPIFAEALRVEPPDVPQLLCGVDTNASGAVVISRTAAAHQWLSAWVAGEPAAIAAAAATLGAGTDSRGNKQPMALSGRRAKQQQKKLQRLTAAAAAVEATGSSSGGVARYTAQEVAGLQQLMAGVGGLRLRRVFWAVVQGKLPARQSGTLRNRMLRGDLALPSLTRYRVLASCEGLSWLELQPLTNRQNQMRLHCGKTLGAPIVGDYKYGYRPWGASASVQPRLARYRSRVSPAATANSVAAAAWKGAYGLESDQHSQGAGSHNSDKIEPLMLHCREVVLLRPRKPPVRVIAPLPRSMKQLMHAMDWSHQS